MSAIKYKSATLRDFTERQFGRFVDCSWGPSEQRADGIAQFGAVVWARGDHFNTHSFMFFEPADGGPVKIDFFYGHYDQTLTGAMESLSAKMGGAA